MGRDHTLPASIEFHDSTLLSIERKGASLRLLLDAYIHHWDMVDGRWKGTGWVQPVEITVDHGVMAESACLPIGLGGGALKIGDVVYSNVVPLPLVASTLATLRLEVTSGESLEITGLAFSIRTTGRGELCEDLPDDWAPTLAK